MKFQDAKILIVLLEYPFIESECVASTIGMYEYSKWLCAGENYPRNQIEMMLTSGTSPSRAHNKAVNEFLDDERGFRSLMIIGRDHIFRPDALQRLFEADKDIIGGITTGRLRSFDQLKQPIYSIVSDWVGDKATPLTKLQCLNKMKEHQYAPWKVPAIGDGLALFKRKVFEKMEPPWFNEPEMPKDEIPEGRRRGTVGCDIIFCKKARELGFEIWAHPGVQYVHIGRSYTSVAY